MKRHLLLALAIMLTAMASTAQVLNIGGHRAPVDSINHLWLCSIPQSLFGTDYETQVSYGDDLTDVVIEGIEGEGTLSFGDFLTFTYKDGKAELLFLKDEQGQGRVGRRALIPRIKNIRVVVDTSILEIYVNNGGWVFSTRFL